MASDIGGVSRHLKSEAAGIFVQQLNRVNIKSPNNFVRGIHKGSVMRYAFPCDILMLPHIREAGHSTPPAPHSLHSRVAHLPVARIRYYSGTRPQCRSRCHHSSAVWYHWKVAQARGRRVLEREELYHIYTWCWKWMEYEQHLFVKCWHLVGEGYHSY